MRLPALAPLAALLLVPAACSTPEEKLVDRRHELRSLLGRIHEQYTGRPEGDRGGAPEEAGIIGRLTTNMERTHFEQYCLAVGRGERPFSLSSRLEEFMRDEDHVKDCREAARLQAQIEKLEQTIAERAAR
jgi:hypothetical protein